MKKLSLFILILFLGIGANAKAKKDTNRVKFYLEVGGSAWNHFGLNHVIVNNGGESMHTFTPDFGSGLIFGYRNFQFNMNISADFSKEKSGNIPYRFDYGEFILAGRYKILKIKNQSLYAGLMADLTTMYADLLPKNSTVDLNHLNPATQVGEVNLRNTSFLLGPTIATGDLFPKSSFDMNIIVSYGFIVTRSKWKSKRSEILNSPVEDGSRLRVSVVFPLF